jgi:hypothetical protein
MTGTEHVIEVGTMRLDNHDPHYLPGRERDLRLVCMFTPG